MIEKRIFSSSHFSLVAHSHTHLPSPFSRSLTICNYNNQFCKASADRIEIFSFLSFFLSFFFSTLIVVVVIFAEHEISYFNIIIPFSIRVLLNRVLLQKVISRLTMRQWRIWISSRQIWEKEWRERRWKNEATLSCVKISIKLLII